MKRCTQVLTFILIAAILAISCKKEDDPPTVEPTQIVLQKTNLKPLELAIIEVSVNLDSQESYSGSIESEPIQFKPNGHFMIFQVPTGATGSKNGNVTINGKSFDFEYELIANSYTDPEIFLQNYFQEQQFIQTQLEDLQEEFIEDGIPGFEEIQTDFTSWEHISNEAEAELAALSAQDKITLAQLMDANSEWIEELDNRLLYTSIYSMTNRASASECRSLIDEGRIELFEGRTFAAAGTAVKAYWCSLTFDERQYEDLDNDFERGSLLMTDVEFTPGLDVLNTLANLVFRKMDAITKELQGSMSSNGVAEDIENADFNRSMSEIPFGNGVPEEIFAKIRFRSINQSDIHTDGPVGEAATFFDQLITSYNELVIASNQPLIWRPGFTQTSVVKDFNQFLTIPPASVTNSDIVLINTQYVDDKWEVAFGNDGTEEEPTFNFDLYYDDGYVQLQKTVTAKISACNPNPCNGLTSISWGGDTYQLVEIGCQCWFAENLKYEGDMPEIIDDEDWANNGENPAWSYYNTSYWYPLYNETYGKLYNWYAVNTGILCPEGWSIPTHDQWTILTDYLGGEDVAGGKMKTLTGWFPSQNVPTNSSGFSGLPGGLRSETGTSADIEQNGIWWSSSAQDANTAWTRLLNYDYNSILRLNENKNRGFSCRCIKD
ncbi:MAG: fibrobacter succinogenes major paralogous domain-containing protein [Aquaticitalea sp.]